MIIKSEDECQYISSDYISKFEIKLKDTYYRPELRPCKIIAYVDSTEITIYSGQREQCTEYLEKLLKQIEMEKRPKFIINPDSLIQEL